MIRTQIQLTDEQWKALRKMASERNQSLSELVRQAVDVILRQRGEMSREKRWQRAAKSLGRFHSGLGDLSGRHDEYLSEAYEK